MRTLLNVIGLLAFALIVVEARDGRDFSVFKVVRFPNGACESSNNRNGTCFTKQECEDKGGKEQGTCADGYGVCCTFEIDECDKTSSQNNTYITNPSTIEAGECTTTICPAGGDICRLRLDLMTFTLAQPASDIAVAAGVKTNDGATVRNVGQCLEDSFRVTCPGGPTPNVICGTNTNQHMYVDAAEDCNDITFFIGPNSNTRMWNIKVSQIECSDYVNLPPQGCMQWYRESTGHIQTFNFGTGQKHLANQNQKICFRKNKGNCGVCFINEAMADFSVSGGMAAGALADAAGTDKCCGYGMAASGFDCLQVPGARQADFAVIAGGLTEFCGSQHLNFAEAAISVSICTSQLPLSVRFVSDAGEAAMEVMAAALQSGFNLKYEQKSTCT